MRFISSNSHQFSERGGRVGWGRDVKMAMVMVMAMSMVMVLVNVDADRGYGPIKRSRAKEKKKKSKAAWKGVANNLAGCGVWGEGGEGEKIQ